MNEKFINIWNLTSTCKRPPVSGCKQAMCWDISGKWEDGPHWWFWEKWAACWLWWMDCCWWIGWYWGWWGIGCIWCLDGVRCWFCDWKIKKRSENHINVCIIENDYDWLLCSNWWASVRTSLAESLAQKKRLTRYDQVQQYT